ncbi:cyclomaltodextrinase C-terminal domain-containing protein, partial [Pseudoalteromonas sp. BSi20652]
NKNKVTQKHNLDYMQEVIPKNANAQALFTQHTFKLTNSINLEPMTATVLVINTP